MSNSVCSIYSVAWNPKFEHLFVMHEVIVNMS